MIKRIIVSSIILFQFGHSENWINKNIELTINGKFRQALALLEQKIETDSTDFRSYFYLAATLNSKMTHFENMDFESEFYNAINKTIKWIEFNQQTNSSLSDSLNAQYLFYLGSAYGYRGYFEGRKSNWYTALSDGLKAINLLEEAVELDSTLMQAYLGIGTYDYWSSSKLKFALWLPFIPDNRERGIELIKKSLEVSGPTRYMAMHQLVYILIDYELFDEAEIYATDLIKIYPESQFMWWAYAHVYYKQRKYDEAILSYIHLLELILNDEEANPSHIVKCNLKLAQLYFESEKFEECILHCNAILKNEKFLFNSDNISEEISELQDYFDKAIEKINY